MDRVSIIRRLGRLDGGGGPLFAAVGIILRGASYALRAGARESEMRTIDSVLGVASLITPFALGAAAGGLPPSAYP